MDRVCARNGHEGFRCRRAFLSSFIAKRSRRACCRALVAYRTSSLSAKLDEDYQWEYLAECDSHTVTGWNKRWEIVNSHFTKDVAEGIHPPQAA